MATKTPRKKPATKTAKTKKKPMTAAHKEALAAGRAQGRAVRAYLEALQKSSPGRGRRRSVESMADKLEKVENKLAGNDITPLARLQLIQEKLDLTAGVEAANDVVDLASLEKDFVANVGPYSERKKIGYSAWREMKVPPAVLKQAGISRNFEP